MTNQNIAIAFSNPENPLIAIAEINNSKMAVSGSMGIESAFTLNPTIEARIFGLPEDEEGDWLSCFGIPKPSGPNDSFSLEATPTA